MQKKPKLKERKPMFNMKPKHKQMISNNHEQMKNSIGGANLEVFKFTLVLHLISFLPIHYLLQIQLRNDSASFSASF